MLGLAAAAVSVTASRLFDAEWYAALVGERFASREEAVARWLADPGDDSPHPLFEPVWLYPGGRWRRHSPDPLSYYLARPAGQRSPHPLYRQADLGPLEEWLEHHDPAELLTAPVPRRSGDRVRVALPDDPLPLAVRWVRHADELGVGSLTVPTSPARRRVLAAVAASRPGALLEPEGGADDVVVVRPHGAEPPSWPWLDPLLAALDRPGVAEAQPLTLAEDHTVAAPVLVGHPVSAVERLDGATLPEPYAGLSVRRAGGAGRTVLATGSWVRGPVDDRQADPAWAHLARAARAVTVVEGRPSLTWSLDVVAPAGPHGRLWGDWHFARALGDALERLGQRVEIDHPATRGRATRDETDVVLALRGLRRVPPQPGAVNLLWVISHPDDVSAGELAEFDVAHAASTAWARRHGVRPLLQCTDATRFHPGLGRPADAGPALFVGNARGGPRPVVTAARAAGVPVTVYGALWEEHGVEVAADRLANDDLPAAYAGAAVVLNDHHADMREAGFVSNRVFDVLAVGGRLLTDDVAGLDEVAGGVTDGVRLPVWRTADDLARLARPPFADHPDAEARAALARHVVAAHSFDARAATLLDAALEAGAGTGTPRRP